MVGPNPTLRPRTRKAAYDTLGISGVEGSGRRLAVQGTLWTVLAFGGAQIIRLGGSLLSTRLLFPELFGLMAIVQTIYVGLALFSDVGLNVSIVRHKNAEDPELLKTAWTMQIVRGFCLWFATMALSPLAATFYDDDRLLWLLPVVGANAVISGFNSTSIFLLRKRVAVRAVALLELGSQAIGLVVLLLWAWVSPSIFALVAGGIVSTVANLAGSHLLNRPRRDRIGWNSAVALELVSFGKWIFASTAVTFLANQTDRLILGKLYSLDMLGVYNVAFSLSDVPRALLLAVSGKVVFPLLARASELPRDCLREKVARPRFYLLTLSAVMLAGIVGCGDLLIRVLYDGRYHDAAWILPILAAGVWPSFLSRTTDSMLFVVGKPEFPAVGFALSFAALISGTLLGHKLAGELGAVVGIAISPIPHYIVVSFGLRRERFWFARQDAQTTIIFALATAAILMARSACGLHPAVLNAIRASFAQ